MLKPTIRVIKLCLIAGTVMFLSSTANAQIEVGTKLGVNINQFNQPGTVINFNGGAFARYPVLDFLSVRAEVLYMQLGGARESYGRDVSGIADGNISSIFYRNRYVNLNNLEVPVIAELTHPDFSEETIKPKLLLGLAYGFLLSANESSEKTYFYNSSSSSGNELTFSDTHENVRSDYEHNQFAFIVGMAMDFKIGEKTFTSEIRYRKSLTQMNLINTITGVPGQFGDLYPSTLSFNFGMTLFNF